MAVPGPINAKKGEIIDMNFNQKRSKKSGLPAGSLIHIGEKKFRKQE